MLGDQYLSQTDCFVTLWLPTASREKLRTRTISNCRHPEWDESFTFQIQTQVKNVLELSVCDEDTFTSNDHLLTVLYDLSKLCLRNKTHVKFPLNPEGMEELEVEFLLSETPSSPEMLITNGVIVSRQVSCLEVHAEPRRPRKRKKNKDLLVVVTDSFENTQCIPPCLEPCGSGDRACFHYPKYFQPQLHAEAPESHWNCGEEVEFLQKRKVVVTKALSQVLQLEEDLREDEVPLIAIMATGGGTRSMVALYGHLLGLQKLNLLDCSTYLTGLSGATWTMATLYNDAEWSSKNLEPVIFEARRHVVKDKMPALYPDQLCKWREELRQHSQEGYKTNFTDFWGKLIEYSLGDKKYDRKLSEQRAALCQGQNPLPIYLTINVKDDVSNQDFREWFEFSPYEVGMQKYGAFVPTELFGSEFFMGRLMKRIPEPEMCYMLGLWSSIFSLNLLDAWNLSHTSEEFFYRWTREKLHDIEDDPLLPEIPKCDANPLETTVVIPASWLSNTFREILTHRPQVSEFHNFLYGMQLHTDYLQNKQFSMWKGVQCSKCPPIMLQPLKQTCEYCTEQNIPFPSYSIQEDDKSLKECYLIENPQKLDAPIVAYFPLISDTFQKYKAPGVERSPEEMELGQLNIYGPKSPYATKELTYTEAAFDKMVKLTEYNILNNKDKLIQAVRLAVEKKRMKSQCSS
ncbi:hypothetical protein A6R68_23577 [Neotoma lepida]|uniref:Phospholipase A2 n=1 Tax=Neotoma lepida TaxID=56216 RepID=A0A1A6HWR0_NEOLE|nr:hypothetical protein A6R68_23577 [Neotoma lepida]